MISYLDITNSHIFISALIKNTPMSAENCLLSLQKVSINVEFSISFQHQLQSLQSYVNELSDQNEILVQTVEELEREANDRVALVESKLQRTMQSLKVLKINVVRSHAFSF